MVGKIHICTARSGFSLLLVRIFIELLQFRIRGEIKQIIRIGFHELLLDGFDTYRNLERAPNTAHIATSVRFCS